MQFANHCWSGVGDLRWNVKYNIRGFCLVFPSSFTMLNSRKVSHERLRFSLFPDISNAIKLLSIIKSFCNVVYQIKLEAVILKLFILEVCYFYFRPEEAFEFPLHFLVSLNWVHCCAIILYKPCFEQYTAFKGKITAKSLIITNFWRNHKHFIFRKFKHFAFESLIPVRFVPKTVVPKISLHFLALSDLDQLKQVL